MPAEELIRLLAKHPSDPRAALNGYEDGDDLSPLAVASC